MIIILLFYLPEAEMWHLNSKSISSDPVADSRHGHSAVVYDGAMFIYGGMSNLVAKDDLWQYNFSTFVLKKTNYLLNRSTLFIM